MERYTYFDSGKFRLKIDDTEYSGDWVERLAAYEETGLEPEELAQAKKKGRLVVLEHAAKKGEKKPPCFYNDMGQEFCLGLARGECDDEPIDRCKECWYCESTREAAEAALKEREAEHEQTD